ncbi:MAG: hypothetical protein AAFZ11_12755 [Pseudomonadota bacterium]
MSRRGAPKAITRTTLDEDFALGEGIPAGLLGGANAELTFGRFEGALTAFNQTVADALADTGADTLADRGAAPR